MTISSFVSKVNYSTSRFFNKIGRGSSILFWLKTGTYVYFLILTHHGQTLNAGGCRIFNQKVEVWSFLSSIGTYVNFSIFNKISEIFNTGGCLFVFFSITGRLRVHMYRMFIILALLDLRAFFSTCRDQEERFVYCTYFLRKKPM
jgi:hypothetical protein